MQAVAAALLRCPGVRVTIEGHTDNVGNPASNHALSNRRAQAVLDDLADRGVPRDRMTAAGFGQTRPIAPNDTADGRAENRRIDFVLQ